ncbi:chitinase domain-containing protein 1 [Euwallacea similis]|uniref:chitinase domain-containing protein 1 n=1 Tax=Euwallacea similis TaxID=1736056 RepID=UPI0034510A55
MNFSRINLVLALIFSLTIPNYASQTLSPKNRGAKKKQEDKPLEKPKMKLPKPKSGPQKYSVFDKKFVSEEATALDILTNYQAFHTEVDDYNFNGLVLGYVTPWNNHGYDVAKIFGNKFNFISPVWLQVRRRGPLDYDVTGIHDIDKQWVINVRNAGRERNTKVVPRILFDSWTGEDYRALFKNSEEISALNEILVKSCKQYRFDGYVFEVWSQLAGGVPSDILVNFILSISNKFASEGLDFILVVPPKRGESSVFSEQQFDALYDYVTAFSLMTYDYSSPQMPGPNAPIGWIEDTITSITSNITRRSKILMGLNFYGNDYTDGGGGSIVGHDYIKILKKVPDLTLIYNQEVGEHYFEYKDENNVKHLVFYPTLYSIFARLDLAYKLNVGLSIWEIGQGLDYFYDLL